MEKKLVMAIAVGLAGFAVIFSLVYVFKGFNVFLYIMMILFLIGYAIFLKSLVAGKIIAKPAVVQKPQPIAPMKKPIINIIKKPFAIKPLIVKKILSAKKKVSIIDIALDDYIKYNLYYGRKKEDIIKKLVDNGWNEKKVEAAFKKVGNLKPVMVSDKNLNKEEKSVKKHIIKEFKGHKALKKGSGVFLDKKIVKKLKKYEGQIRPVK